MQRCAVWFAVAWILLGTGLAHAHHSRSAFDLDTLINVQGTVVEVAWTNPHYYLSVVDARAERWVFEGHSIPGLVRNGWSRHSVTVGSAIRVQANPNRDPEQRFALLDNVTRADGKRLFAFRRPDSAPAPTPPADTGFAGTWRLIRSLRDNLVSGFDAPVDWPVTAKGRAQVAAYDLRDDPSLRCEPRGLPRMLAWPYAQRWQIEAGVLRIRIEHATEVREIGLDGSAVPGPPAGDPQGLGVSIATRASEDRLVIETSRFAPRAWGTTRGLDSGAGKSLREHYELVDGGQKMKLTYTVHDPEYLLDPVDAQLWFQRVATYEFAAEPPCDVHTAQRHLEYEP